MSSPNPFSNAQAAAGDLLNQGSGSNWKNGLPGILSGLLGLFGNSEMQNPGSAGMPYLQGLPDELKNIFGPYLNAGQGALGSLQGQLGGLSGLQGPLMDQISKLLSNPGQVINQIGSNFQASPGYQFQVNQATKAANQAAAAGGMAGSPQEQQQLAGTVNQLANQDYYNYLGNALGEFNQGIGAGENLYGQGLQGQEFLGGLGANAANQYASGLGNVANNQALLAALSAMYGNQQTGSEFGDFGNILGGIGKIAGFL